MDSALAFIITIFVIQLIVMSLINPGKWTWDISGTDPTTLVGYAAGIIFLAFGASIIYYLVHNQPQKLISDPMKYSLAIVIPILCITLAIAYAKPTSAIFYAIYAVLFVFFLVGLPLIYKLDKSVSNIMTYLFIILVLCGFVVALAMLYIMLRNMNALGSSLSENTSSNFIVKFIFFIPCLLLDLVSYIQKEAKITANIVYILLVIELLIILAYNYLSKLSKVMSTSANSILPGTAYLDVKQQLGNPELIAPKLGPNIDLTLKPKSAVNYALSMWIYLNPQTNSGAQEYNIFTYNKDKSPAGNPRIAYLPSAASDSYYIYFTNATTSAYKITLPKQKWNHFTFNYSDNKVDLFINGAIKYTYDYTNSISNSSTMPTYSSNDIITIGQDKGLYGAISNIKAYDKPLTQYQIVTEYNLLALKNPPTDM